MGSFPIGKLLMLAGGALLVVGAFIHFGGKYLPIGRLPGDFHWHSGNFSFYFPVATSVLLSIVLTILLNLLFRR
ncbi:MAG: DUF2905 domain-containing protein [Sporomusaceae bacterium]|nr:DUF2905 domain-containing protein [Sporomusaceae bacterium]